MRHGMPVFHASPVAFHPSAWSAKPTSHLESCRHRRASVMHARLKVAQMLTAAGVKAAMARRSLPRASANHVLRLTSSRTASRRGVLALLARHQTRPVQVACLARREHSHLSESSARSASRRGWCRHRRASIMHARLEVAQMLTAAGVKAAMVPRTPPQVSANHVLRLTSSRTARGVLALLARHQTRPVQVACLALGQRIPSSASNASNAVKDTSQMKTTSDALISTSVALRTAGAIC